MKERRSGGAEVRCRGGALDVVDAARGESGVTVRALWWVTRGVGVAVVVGRARIRAWPAVEACLRCAVDSTMKMDLYKYELGVIIDTRCYTDTKRAREYCSVMCTTLVTLFRC